MLRRLYRCAVRLHPFAFRRRFGEEMLYIFDQQKGTLAALGVTVDCILSLFRQWALRPHVATELHASPLQSSTADHIPSFESLDPFQPNASAMITGTLLSLILFYMTVVAIPYSWIHVLNPRVPEIAGNPTQLLSGDSITSSEHPQVDVIPTDSEGFQAKSVASSIAHTPAARVRARGETIWLDRYVGQYVSKNPTATISVQIEEDPLRGNHLSLSLDTAGHSSLALSPVSQEKFAIIGAENNYVEFTPDAEGRICCLSFVVNGNVITARRR
jgi:hypothetical protein